MHPRFRQHRRRSCTLADAPEIEADGGNTEVVERPRERVNHFVIERAATERVRMADDAESCHPLETVRRLDAGFDLSRGPLERHALIER